MTDWHIGTPRDDGLYICKVHCNGDTPNDMRILEWVGELGCFCIPSKEKTRGYHFYIGLNGGRYPEVVYEWMRLDMRFRFDQKGWLGPDCGECHDDSNGRLSGLLDIMSMIIRDRADRDGRVCIPDSFGIGGIRVSAKDLTAYLRGLLVWGGKPGRDA